MKFKTASAILGGPWFIDKRWAESHLPVVASLLRNQPVSAGMFDGVDEHVAKKETEPIRVATINAGVVYQVGYYTDFSRIPEGSIARVSFTGPLLKYGGECSYGMVDKAHILQRAANAPNIKGIILDIDSPGGQVAGTAMVADLIKAISKPTIALIDDGIAASAAMWIASAANEIYVTQKTDMVGSVGVYTTIYDFAGMLEAEGIKVHEIYAPQSKDKNRDYKEAIKGNYELIEAELSVLADEFISTIKRNRSGKLADESWSTGSMYYAADAIKLGLIDGVKTFEQAVRRMDQLISNKQSQSNNSNMAFQNTLVAAKTTQFAVVDGGFLLEEAHLNNIEASLAAHETAATNLETVNGQLATATADLATANNSLATANARITELENMGGESSKTGKEADVFATDKVDPMAMDFQKDLLSKLD